MLPKVTEHLKQGPFHQCGYSLNIQAAFGKYDELLTLGKKRELRWFGHVTRSSGLAKTILQGTVQGKEEKVDRRRGGKIILKGGQGWTLLTQQGQLKTGLGGKELL